MQCSYTFLTCEHRYYLSIYAFLLINYSQISLYYILRWAGQKNGKFYKLLFGCIKKSIILECSLHDQ